MCVLSPLCGCISSILCRCIPSLLCGCVPSPLCECIPSLSFAGAFRLPFTNVFRPTPLQVCSVRCCRCIPFVHCGSIPSFLCGNVFFPRHCLRTPSLQVRNTCQIVIDSVTVRSADHFSRSKCEVSVCGKSTISCRKGHVHTIQVFSVQFIHELESMLKWNVSRYVLRKNWTSYVRGWIELGVIMILTNLSTTCLVIPRR